MRARGGAERDASTGEGTLRAPTKGVGQQLLTWTPLILSLGFLVVRIFVSYSSV